MGERKTIRITKRDATMFALYLVVIAMGVIMMDNMPFLGFTQIALGAGFLGLRLWSVAR